MKSFIVLFFLAVVCSTLGASSEKLEDYDLVVPTGRDFGYVTNTTLLITQLAGNLRKSGQEALNAVGTFKAGIRDEVQVFKNKIVDDILKFRNRITAAVDNVMNRISNSSLAVKKCVNSARIAAAAVFSDTLSSTMTCVDERIAGVTKNIDQLAILSTEGIACSAKALEDMKKCSIDHTNLIAVGSCLGVVAFQTELKSAAITGRILLLTGHIKLDIITMAPALEVCAGMRLIQASLATGKIILEIGTCSVSGVISALASRPQIY